MAENLEELQFASPFVFPFCRSFLPRVARVRVLLLEEQLEVVSSTSVEIFSWTTASVINKSGRTTMRLSWTFWDILGHFGTFWDNSEDF